MDRRPWARATVTRGQAPVRGARAVARPWALVRRVRVQASKRAQVSKRACALPKRDRACCTRGRATVPPQCRPEWAVWPARGRDSWTADRVSMSDASRTSENVYFMRFTYYSTKYVSPSGVQTDGANSPILDVMIRLMDPHPVQCSPCPVCARACGSPPAF